MELTEQLFLFLRIVVAGICGILIGIERTNRAKEAGIRTHCVVALASALMMIISKYGFFDQIAGGTGVRGADSARIAAQVVSGVGFLGAGMIFVHKNTITGLTTAAGIWATSGIGMAIGAGMYSIGVASTGLIILIQILLHANRGIAQQQKKPRMLKIQAVEENSYQQKLEQELTEIGVALNTLSVKTTADGKRNYTFSIVLPQEVNEDTVLDMIPYECGIEN